MNKLAAGAIAGTAVVAAQGIGSLKSPSPSHPRTAAWYARLRKPSYTPPGPVFGVAWTALDVLLGYTGYRLMTARPGAARTASLTFWALNLLGVGGYSWVMFGRKRLDEATGVTAAMLATTVGSVAASSQVDRPAALAGVPLALWVVFATLIQEEVWRKNP